MTDQILLLETLSLGSEMAWFEMSGEPISGDCSFAAEIEGNAAIGSNKALVALQFSESLSEEQLTRMGITRSGTVGPYVYLHTGRERQETSLSFTIPVGIYLEKVGLRTWDTQAVLSLKSFSLRRGQLISAAQSAPPRFIIKADDLRLTMGIEKFARLFDLCREFQVPVSAGIIGRGLKYGHYRDRKMIESLVVAGELEIWNHSLNHRNMLEMTPEQVEYEIAATNSACVQGLNVLPVGFGAPFNKCSDMIVGAARRMGLAFTYESLFPKEAYFTPEQNAAIGKQPNFEVFLDGVKNCGTAPVIVMQIHPPRWTPHGFDEFRRILGWLRDHDYQATTALACAVEAAGVDGSSVSAQAVSLHQNMVARLGEFWEARAVGYNAHLSNFSSYFLSRFSANSPHIRSLLDSMGADTGGRIVVDVGCGLAQWSLPFLDFDEDCIIYAFDTNKTIHAALTEARRYGLLTDRFQSCCQDYTNNDLLRPGSVSYVVCANAVNYMPLQDFAAKTKDLCHEGALVLLHFQTDAFNLAGFRTAAREGNAAQARERGLAALSHFLVRQGYAAFLPARSTPTAEEMEAIMYAHGFRLHDMFLAPFESLEDGQPTFCGSVFRRDTSVDATKLTGDNRISFRKTLCRAGYAFCDESLFNTMDDDFHDRALRVLKTRAMGSILGKQCSSMVEAELADLLNADDLMAAAALCRAADESDEALAIAGFVLAVRLEDIELRQLFVERIVLLATVNPLRDLCVALHGLLGGRQEQGALRG